VILVKTEVETVEDGWPQAGTYRLESDVVDNIGVSMLCDVDYRE
jgi:hypothetical protein